MSFRNPRWRARPVPKEFLPTKSCRGPCRLERPREDFGSRPTNADMRDNVCKACRAAMNRARKSIRARTAAKP